MQKNTDQHFIGRESELGHLRSAFAAARQGQGRVILVAGEAGSGKTRLVEEALRQASCAPYNGRAREESNPPYGPIVAALRDCLRHQPATLLDTEPLLRPLASLLPELGRSEDPAEPDGLLEAIARLLILAAGAGCAMVFLDDLHWADNATLELLTALTDRLHHEPVIVIATYRADEITRSHALRRVRSELRRSRRLVEINLEPLSRDETAELIARTLEEQPSPDLVAAVYSRTQGIPLYIEELTRAMALGGHLRPDEEGVTVPSEEAIPIPESIRDAILLRLDALSEEARGLLEVAAVAGTEFDPGLIASIGGSERGLDELIERQVILEIEPGRMAFRHALLREACRAEITWSRRRSLHRTLGETLAAAGASPEVVAEHWLAANEQEKAREALLASADHSCRVHAYRDAAHAAHRALDIWPDGKNESDRLETLEQLARCAQMGGQLTEAIRAWREVLASPLLREDARRRGKAYRALATVYALQGAWEQGIEARRAAAASLQQAGLVQEAAAEWLAAAGRLMATSQLTAAIEAAATAAELAGQVDNADIQARAMGLQGEALATRGDFEAGREVARAGLSLALKHNNTEAASDVYRRLANALTAASDYTGAREVYSTALDFCRTNDVTVHAQICLSCMSYVLFMNGDWKQALTVCDEVINSEHAPPGSIATGYGVAGLVHAYRGETRQARGNLQKALSEGRKRKIFAMEMLAYWGLAIVEENEQAWDTSGQYHNRILECWDRSEDRHDIIAPLCSAVAFFADRGMAAEASQCTQILTTIASHSASQEALSGLAYALGLSALLNEDAVSAQQQFEQSLLHLEKLDIPVAHALVSRQLGHTKIRNGQREDGIADIRSAYRLARRLGARPLASRLAAELAELGEPAEERRGSEIDGEDFIQSLTRRQLEVARLLAAGLTNKEIAQKLFLSPRTVDMHVANILDRLNARSRTDAVRRATKLGLLAATDESNLS